MSKYYGKNPIICFIHDNIFTFWFIKCMLYDLISISIGNSCQHGSLNCGTVNRTNSDLNILFLKLLNVWLIFIKSIHFLQVESEIPLRTSKFQ